MQEKAITQGALWTNANEASVSDFVQVVLERIVLAARQGPAALVCTIKREKHVDEGQRSARVEYILTKDNSVRCMVVTEACSQLFTPSAQGVCLLLICS